MKESKISTTSLEAEALKDSLGKEEFEKGLRHYEKNQVKKALTLFHSAALKEFPPAYIYLYQIYGTNFDKETHYLGAMYLKQAQKYQKWFLNYAKTTENTEKNTEAQFYLGAIAPFTQESSKLWFEYTTKAASAGHRIAQYNFGVTGSQHNSDQTYQKWIEESAKQGYAPALLFLAIKNDQNPAYDVNDKRIPKPEYYEAAADKGVSQAKFMLGYCYELGLSIEKDLKQAAGWYQAAIWPTYYYPQWRLAMLHEKGEGNEWSKTKALYHYLQLVCNKNQDSEVSEDYADYSKNAILQLTKKNPKLKAELLIMLLDELDKNPKNSDLNQLFKELTGKKYADYSQEERKAHALLSQSTSTFFPTVLIEIVKDYLHNSPIGLTHTGSHPETPDDKPKSCLIS